MQKTKQNFKLTIRGVKVTIGDGEVIVASNIPTNRLIKILLYLKSEGFV